MLAKDAIIGWTPKSIEDEFGGKIKVGLLGEQWADDYRFINGACCPEWQAMPPMSNQMCVRLFAEFAYVVVSGIDPIAAHEEFLKIDEYAMHIAVDLPGVRERVQQIEDSKAYTGN